MDIELKGNKVRLVNSDPLDIDQIADFEGLNRQFVNQYTREKHLSLLNDADCLHLSIRRLDNDKLTGHILIFGLTDPNKVLEFRRITISDKGLGFGREAIKLLKQICFERLRFHRLWLDVYEDNERAISLYESEGFVKEGILRENTKTDTGYRSQRIYSILDYEYENLKGRGLQSDNPARE